MQQLTNSKFTRSKWMILSAILIFVCLCCVSAQCQSTTATATVVDQAGTVWANGNYKFDFVPNPNYPSNNVNWNGNPFPSSQWSYSGILDDSGAFSRASLPSNNFITPVGSTYTLTVCPNASSPCSVIVGLTLQGTSLDLSSTITAATKAPFVNASPIPRAYKDEEVNVNNTLVGYFYQNVTTNSPRYWNGSFWSDFVTGVTTFHSGNLNPLFTTSIGSDPENPVLNFTLDQANALVVFGNCSGTIGNPSFCNITSNMLPANIASNTSGSAATLSGALSACGTHLFAKGISSNGNAVCAQPNFTDLAGNIAVSQMDSGTNADATHVWIGSGHWQSFAALAAALGIKEIHTASAAGCSTPSGPTGTGCPNTLTWSDGGFADTNYTPVCSGSNPFTSGSSSEPNAVDLIGYLNKTNTTIDTETVAKGSDGGASFGTITCVGVHN